MYKFTDILKAIVGIFVTVLILGGLLGGLLDQFARYNPLLFP